MDKILRYNLELVYEWHARPCVLFMSVDSIRPQHNLRASCTRANAHICLSGQRNVLISAEYASIRLPPFSGPACCLLNSPPNPETAPLP